MNDTRIEKKFIFGKYQNDFVEKLLLINNFSKVYPDREISSIYLDTLNFNFAKDNIRFNCVSPGGVFDNQNIEFVKKWMRENAAHFEE